MIFTKELLKEYINEELEKYESSEKSVYKFTLSEKIKKIIFAILGRKMNWKEPETKIDGKAINNILLFRYDAIGDYIVSSSVIRWLKKAIPDVNIDIITSPRNHQLAINDPLVRKAYQIPYDDKYSFRMFKILKYRNKCNYDILFSFVYWNQTKSALLSNLISPNSEKISIRHNKRKHIYGLVFNRLTDAAFPGLSWADRMVKCAIDNIEPVNPVSSKDTQPYIYIKDSTYKNIMPLIKENQLNYDLNTDNIVFFGDEDIFYQASIGSKYCVINIAGTDEARILNINKVVSCCKELINLLPDIKIFISGGPAYKMQVEDIVSKFNSPNCFALNIGLLEFIAFVAGAYFVVSPDTGVVHIAAAANVPVLVLFAEKTKIIQWFPHCQKYVMLLSPNSESLDYISNEEILEGIKLLISDIEDTNN